MNNKIWYAILMDQNDDDLGSGSYDPDTANQILKHMRAGGLNDAYIAVISESIDDDGNVKNWCCIDEIRNGWLIKFESDQGTAVDIQTEYGLSLTDAIKSAHDQIYNVIDYKMVGFEMPEIRLEGGVM